MALNESIIIAGVEVIPSMTEGEKSALQFTFPSILGKKVKDKETKEETQKPLIMAKRTINDVARFFPALDDKGRADISATQLPAAFPAVAKAVKEAGYQPVDFYLAMSGLATSLEQEVEQKSASDHRVNLARAIASLFTNDDTIPESSEEMREMLAKMVADLNEADLKVITDRLTTAETDNGRFPEGAIRWSAPRAKKGEDAAQA